MEKLKNLSGMRDFSEEYWSRLNSCQDSLRWFFTLHGYSVLETPLIEPTELFLRKSGGELAARMYKFTDPGGNQVSLRPEYTASILRYYLQESPPGPLPLRVQYSGPVFRYQEDTSASRQFVQIGAELLGSSSPRADAEILALACGAVSRLGLSSYRLEMGDVGVLRSILESLGLSERAVAFILSGVPQLKAGENGRADLLDRAAQLGLFASGASQGHLSSALAGLQEDEARELLHGMLEWSETGDLGQRTPSEVVERMLRKFRGTDDSAKLQRGIEMVSALAQVKGEPHSSLAAAEELMRSWDKSLSVLDGLKQVIGLLDSVRQDGADVVLDFGMARGLAYYSGVVFDITHPSLEGSLGGGGRYDGLAKALGSQTDIPALGFAFGLEQVIEALRLAETSLWRDNGARATVMIRAENDRAYERALEMARGLRDGGTPVEMEVSGMGLEDCLSYAAARGIEEVTSVDADGKGTSQRVQAEQRL